MAENIARIDSWRIAARSLCCATLGFCCQRFRDQLGDSLGVGPKEALDDPAPGRLVFEIDVGAPNAACVFVDEGLAALAALRQGVGR
ncbi:MAG: hypothetical protein WA156_02700 [Methylocystis silviterrae]